MIRFLLLVLTGAFSSGCTTSKPVAPLVFDFVRRGDDGLTMRIGQAIVSELEASGEFVSRKVATESPNLQVQLNGHAISREVGGRVDASVALEVRRSDTASSTSIRCYADETVVCGRAALEFVRLSTVR